MQETSRQKERQTRPVSSTSSSIPEKFRKLALESGADPSEDSSLNLAGASRNCNCGMPLCICVPETVVSGAATRKPNVLQKPQKLPSASPSSPFKPSAVASSGNNMPSLFFSSGQSMHGRGHPLSKSYDLNGEGVREAVKNGDVSAVKELLSQGVDANHFDRQGMSLLHLAAMFNFTEITFMLMDAGANVNAKNAQGETPIDCAQPTLGHKMRQRIEASLIK